MIRYDVFISQVNQVVVRVSAVNNGDAVKKATRIWLRSNKAPQVQAIQVVP